MQMLIPNSNVATKFARIYYVSGTGERAVPLTATPEYANQGIIVSCETAAPLHSHEWGVSSNESSGFATFSPGRRAIQLSITSNNRDYYDLIRRTFDRDVYYNTPGTLIFEYPLLEDTEAYSQRCFVTSTNAETIYNDMTTTTVTIWLIDGFWFRTLLSKTVRPSTAPGEFLDYPYDFDYDFTYVNQSREFFISAAGVFFPISFEVIGPMNSPIQFSIINDDGFSNLYKVSTSLGAGETLRVDQISKEVTISGPNGTRNAFSYAERGSGSGSGSYIFEPVHSGNNWIRFGEPGGSETPFVFQITVFATESELPRGTEVLDA